MKSIPDIFSPSFLENITIQERGIKLPPTQLIKIQTSLQALDSRAPAYSNIFLDFVNQGKSISATLRVSGLGRCFEASLEGQDPWEIYQQLEESVDLQMWRWKKNRFSAQPVESNNRFNFNV